MIFFFFSNSNVYMHFIGINAKPCDLSQTSMNPYNSLQEFVPFIQTELSQCQVDSKLC